VTFIVDDRKNTASFESRAMLETILGVTNTVTGDIAFDPENLSGPVKGSVVIDLASLKTGIDKRDADMKNDFLEVAKYPTATFEVAEIVSSDKPKVADGETANLVVAGRLTIHGVTKEIQAPVTVAYRTSIPGMEKAYPGEVAAVRTTFDVKLADHAVERPQILFLKLDETIHVSVQFTAASGRTKAQS